MDKINVLIAGATGYIGIELVKILSIHKYTKIKYLCGNTSVGKKITHYDKSIKKKLPKITKFKERYLNEVDVIFTALPNGEAQIISKLLNKKNILIDLSADFRLRNTNDYKKWYKKIHKAKANQKKSIYALPEFLEKITKYKIISCPGCYPTSILLPLIPLLKKKLIKNKNIIIDSKSGYSGAGRNVHIKNKNNNLYESISAYGIKNHRHNSEIQEQLDEVSKKTKFYFTPHLSPMFRGILTNIYVDLEKNVDSKKINICLKKIYKKSNFIKIMKPNEMLSTNHVIDTNNCYISICNTNDKKKIIILSVIDNLIKGGAGQAVQNYNNYFNFNSNEGFK